MPNLRFPSPPIHLIVKWSAAHGPDTVGKHMAVASDRGSVWWGLRGTPDKPKIGSESIARIVAQLAAGQDTKVFLSGPTYWKATLSGVAVERAEVDEDLIPDYYPEGQEHGLWVRISDFKETTRGWLTSHLELAKAPGKLLAETSLSQTTNPLIVVEAAGSAPDRSRVWWVCQGSSYKDSKEAGVMWAPMAAKDGHDRPYWSALERARIGDRILHYANSNIRAVGTVTTEAVDAERPTGSDDDWQRDGRLVEVDYVELAPPINLADIPHEWRTDEGGPFTKDGGVQQGYFYRLSDTFVARMAERFSQLGLEVTNEMSQSGGSGTTFDLDALRTRAMEAGLELSDDVLAEVLAALECGKHIILTGPPGTAKTTLAHLVAEAARLGRRSAGWIPTTATADWTTYDTIGGLRPKSDQTLEFKAGHFLSALEGNQWLVIDELNRSNFDRAFGQFFTVLSGQTVVLPHERELGRGPIALVPAGVAPPTEHVDVVVVPDTWRIIATMNVFDKTLLFEMSYALMRRFAFIEVPSPSDGKFAKLIERWAEGDEEAASVGKALLCVRKIDAKDIGPASYRDIVRYAHQRLLIGEQSTERLTFDAFYSFLLPLFEGIDDRQGRELCDAVKAVVAPADRPRLVRTLNTVLGLELSKGEAGSMSASGDQEAVEGLDDLLDGDDPLAGLTLE